MKSDNFAVKSCGTSPASRVKISEKLIHWADIILVMEKRHREIIQQHFKESLSGKDLKVLTISDDYAFMDEQLILILRAKMNDLNLII